MFDTWTPLRPIVVPSDGPRWRRLLVIVLLVLTAAGTTAVHAESNDRPFGFAAPVYVDSLRGGSEPVVISVPCGTETNCTPTLLYSAHQGGETTFNTGEAATAPGGDARFLATDREQAFIWRSVDDGRHWQLANASPGAGFAADPSYDRGFGDPDLTVDAGGRVYAASVGDPTPIDTSYMFSAPDATHSWDQGATPLCELGDRPWIAGARPGEAFVTTEGGDFGGPQSSGLGPNALFRYDATSPAHPCSSASVPVEGQTPDGGKWVGGSGKLVYDQHTGSVLVPIAYSDANGAPTGVGVATLTRDQLTACLVTNAAMCGGFIAKQAAATTTLFTGGVQSILSLAVDSSDTYYLAWADRGSGTGSSPPGSPPAASACDRAANALSSNEGPWASSIKLAISTDHGAHWTTTTVSRPGVSAFKPWITAGDSGKVAISWWQSNQAVNVECDPSDISIRTAFVFNADTTSPSVSIVDPIGHPIHRGTVCMEGTQCAIFSALAPELDRRLGDFFTTATDPDGCLLIATGDTNLADPVTGAFSDPRSGQAPGQPTARPLFIRQDRGPSLTGGDCAH